MGRAASPTSCTIAIAANMRGLVTFITAIIISVAVPQLRDTLAVPAGKFRIWVTRCLAANGVGFIAAVLTILVPIALPGALDAAAGAGALELVLRACVVAVVFVRFVAAIITAVTEGGDESTVVVLALEHTWITNLS